MGCFYGEIWVHSTIQEKSRGVSNTKSSVSVILWLLWTISKRSQNPRNILSSKLFPFCEKTAPIQYYSASLVSMRSYLNRLFPLWVFRFHFFNIGRTLKCHRHDLILIWSLVIFSFRDWLSVLAIRGFFWKRHSQ